MKNAAVLELEMTSRGGLQCPSRCIKLAHNASSNIHCSKTITRCGKIGWLGNVEMGLGQNELFLVLIKMSRVRFTCKISVLFLNSIIISQFKCSYESYII